MTPGAGAWEAAGTGLLAAAVSTVARNRDGAIVKIYLVTPRNPPSFWTYDGILPTLGKDCIFPNLSMPTVAGLTVTKVQPVSRKHTNPVVR